MSARCMYKYYSPAILSFYYIDDLLKVQYYNDTYVDTCYLFKLHFARKKVYI